MTSNPLVRRTRATFRSAELGFFGVVVYTRVQTPRFCGFDLSAGALSLASTIFPAVPDELIDGRHNPELEIRA